ncbi:Ku protein, partial [Streptomyces sp. MnatMP-M17]|uniref:non-homologous end joining protein Ku n=1 Tax=unclassified Streptomyces TaxID=2593676 RepID=UPI00081F0C08
MPALAHSAVSFGLVTIPVAITPATQSHSVAFRQVHTADMGRVRNRRVCDVCGQTPGLEQIGRGYELPDGALVEVTDAELDALPLDSVRAIEVVGFNPVGSVDPLSLGRAYYLTAHGDIAVKPYALLVRALRRTEKIAVARFALRDRERLGLLRGQGTALVLHR